MKTAYRQARKWENVDLETVNDLVQETYFRLNDPKRRILAKFKNQGPGSAHKYIHVVTKHLVIDYFKSRFSGKHGAGITFAVTEDIDVPASEDSFGTISGLDRP